MSQRGSESEGVGSACEAARRPERAEEARGQGKVAETSERVQRRTRRRRGRGDGGVQRGVREEEAAGCRRCMVMGVQWRRMK